MWFTYTGGGARLQRGEMVMKKLLWLLALWPGLALAQPAPYAPGPGPIPASPTLASGYYNVKSGYGATGSGLVLSDLTTTATSTTVSSASYTFTAADVGKYFAIVGATAVVGGSNPLGTLNVTISSVSAGAAVVSAAPSVSIAGTGVGTFGSNDTTAIQAAITAAHTSQSGCGTIFFPQGIYIINAPLTPYSCVSYTGLGAGKSVIKWISTSDATEAMLYSTAGAQSTPFYDVQITNLEWDMEAATLASYGVASKVVFMQWMVRPLIADNYFHGAPATCVGIDYLSQGRIRDNAFTNCGRDNFNGGGAGGAAIGLATTGAWTGGSSVIGNRVVSPSTNYGTYGIFVEGQSSTTPSSASYDIISGNSVVLQNASQKGIGTETTNNTIISSNSVVGNANGSQRGIDVAIATLGSSPTGNYVKISSNNINNVDLGIFVQGTSANETVPNNITIDDNTIRTCIRYCLWVNTGTVQMDGVFVGDNVFTLAGQAGLNISGTAGIKHLHVIGNRLFNNATTTATTNEKAGMSVTSPIAGFDLKDNWFYDDQGSGTQLYGLILDGSSTVISDAHIDANHMNNNVTGALSITNSASLAGWISNNPGYNPQGAETLSPGASPWTYTAANTPEVLYVSGTITSVVKNSVTIASTATQLSIPLDPGEAVVVTYSAALTASSDRK